VRAVLERSLRTDWEKLPATAIRQNVTTFIQEQCFVALLLALLLELSTAPVAVLAVVVSVDDDLHDAVEHRNEVSNIVDV